MHDTHDRTHHHSAPQVPEGPNSPAHDAQGGCDAPLGGRTAPATGAGSRAAATHGTACPCAISLPPSSSIPENPPKTKAAKDSAVLTMWPDGSRVDVPGVRHLNPKATTDPPPSPPKVSKRGKVTGFSEKSRRNFLRQLCTLIRWIVPHTMALTLPNEWEQFDLPFLQQAFKKLGERFDARCNRRPEWVGIALAWKKEPQKRGALHWHLLLYGIDSAELEKEVQAWFADQWNELICAGLDPEERRKHAVWHHHENNWQKVEKVGYFTKYVGKAVEADATGSTGRFWGFWRKPKLPWAAKVEGTIPDTVAVDQNRIARKIRQKRADAAKQAAIAAAIQFNPLHPSNPGQPLSLWDLQRLRQGYTARGRTTRNAREFLESIQIIAKLRGVQIGKYLFKTTPGRPHPDELKITLTGHHIPDTMQRAAQWSAEKHGLRKPKEQGGPFRPKLP